MATFPRVTGRRRGSALRPVSISHLEWLAGAMLIQCIAEEFFGHGWFQPFCLINLWGITALLALIEILALNSIKRQVVSFSV
jgi:hypothetical protein